MLLRYCYFDLFHTNSSLLSILETFCFNKKFEMIRYHTDSSLSQQHCVIQTFYLVLTTIISILHKLENKVEKFGKFVACLFTMRKSLYSLESPLIIK